MINGSLKIQIILDRSDSFSDFWKVCVFYDSISRMSVPLFFMLSGYFLFSKKESLIDFYKKRFSRVLIPFLMLLVIYFKIAECSFRDFLLLTLSGGVCYHLWFVYSISGIYLIIPFFRPLFESQEGLRLIKFYVFIWFVSAVTYPTIQRIYHFEINIFNTFNFNYFFGYLGYFLWGGLLKRYYVNRITRWISLVIYIGSSFLIYELTVYYSGILSQPSEAFFIYLSPLVCAQSVCLFIVLKDLSIKSMHIEYIAKYTYWIYLIHVLIISYTQRIFGWKVSEETLVIILLMAFLVFIFSLLISIPLQMIENIITKKTFK